MPSKKQQAKTAFQTRIDLDESTRAEMGALLNLRLADFLDLERHAKQAHWNVRGPQFHQLHLLFDKVAACAVTWGDEVAERAVQLGVAAEGTVQNVAERSQLVASPMTAASMEWVQHVADVLATCAHAVRADIDRADEAEDAVTTDLLTKLAGEADVQLWMVEAHLDGK